MLKVKTYFGIIVKIVRKGEIENIMDRKELANLIFPDVKDYSYYEEKYPERNLPEGAVVSMLVTYFKD